MIFKVCSRVFLGAFLVVSVASSAFAMDRDEVIAILSRDPVETQVSAGGDLRTQYYDSVWSINQYAPAIAALNQFANDAGVMDAFYNWFLRLDDLLKECARRTGLGRNTTLLDFSADASWSGHAIDQAARDQLRSDTALLKQWITETFTSLLLETDVLSADQIENLVNRPYFTGPSAVLTSSVDATFKRLIAIKVGKLRYRAAGLGPQAMSASQVLNFIESERQNGRGPGSLAFQDIVYRLTHDLRSQNADLEFLRPFASPREESSQFSSALFEIGKFLLLTVVTNFKGEFEPGFYRYYLAPAIRIGMVEGYTDATIQRLLVEKLFAYAEAQVHDVRLNFEGILERLRQVIGVIHTYPKQVSEFFQQGLTQFIQKHVPNRLAMSFYISELEQAAARGRVLFLPEIQKSNQFAWTVRVMGYLSAAEIPKNQVTQVRAALQKIPASVLAEGQLLKRRVAANPAAWLRRWNWPQNGECWRLTETAK